jgi:malic enzyme
LQDVPLTSRQSFNLEGLIPPAETTHDVEIERLKAIVDSTEGRLDKYRFLMTLKEANVHAYMSILQKYPKDIIPLIYTPTVADACENFGLLLVKPIGLYVGLQHKGRIRDLLNQWPSNEVQIVVVTDGERVLGLGDLGVHGMGIVAGKTDIYNAYGGVSPRNVMPVALDVGCNKKDYRENKFYLGSNQERIRGDQYTEFVDEFIEAVCDKFGRDTLFHFEDFGSKNAPVLLKRYQDKGKNVFNDDIQAISVVCLTSILGATHQKGVRTSRSKSFFSTAQARPTWGEQTFCYLTSLRKRGWTGPKQCPGSSSSIQKVSSPKTGRSSPIRNFPSPSLPRLPPPPSRMPCVPSSHPP